ncbi:hypothetical protein EOD12_31670, partial [Mesorhizobium sp. M7A.T.Ca.TU.009.02.1.1]
VKCRNARPTSKLMKLSDGGGLHLAGRYHQNVQYQQKYQPSASLDQLPRNSTRPDQLHLVCQNRQRFPLLAETEA